MPTHSSRVPAPEALPSPLSPLHARLEVVAPELSGAPDSALLLSRALAALECGRIPVLPALSGLSPSDERTLKEAALSRSLLALGPGASMELLGEETFGVFSRVLRSSGIGAVSTDGGALHEFTSLASDHYGAGIPHAIDVGCRDLSNSVGGLMAEAALRALAADENIRAVALIAHRPSDEMACHIAEVLASLGKPAVVRWLGDFGKDAACGLADGVFFAADIDEAAQAAALLSRGEPLSFRKQCAKCTTCMKAEKLREGKALAPRLAWIFGNGALAAEAVGFLQNSGMKVRMPLIPLSESGPLEFSGSLVADASLGRDAFGPSHPALDLAHQAALVEKAVSDASAGAVFFDVTLGESSHPDPASAFIAAVKRGLAQRSSGEKCSPDVVVAATITGTAEDAQNFAEVKKRLRAEGIAVLPTAAKAARVVSELFAAP